jgi:hypothetical protein
MTPRFPQSQMTEEHLSRKITCHKVVRAEDLAEVDTHLKGMLCLSAPSRRHRAPSNGSPEVLSSSYIMSHIVLHIDAISGHSCMELSSDSGWNELKSLMDFIPHGRESGYAVRRSLYAKNDFLISSRPRHPDPKS